MMLENKDGLEISTVKFLSNVEVESSVVACIEIESLHLVFNRMHSEVKAACITGWQTILIEVTSSIVIYISKQKSKGKFTQNNLTFS